MASRSGGVIIVKDSVCFVDELKHRTFSIWMLKYEILFGVWV